MTPRLSNPTLWFAGIALAVHGTAITLAAMLPRLEHPGAVAAGATFDLIVLVPLAFYVLVVRPRGLPVATLAPVLVLSVLGAALVIPRDYHGTLRYFEILLIPLEVALVGSVVWRAVGAIRRSAGAGDVLQQFRVAARKVVPLDRAAEILASELAVAFYAFGSWRAAPHVPAGMQAFTQHQRSGQGGIVFAVLVLMVVEGVAVHLLLARWSEVAAWVLTIGSVYGALWLVADFRATVLRPILVDSQEVWIRARLRWNVRLPRSLVSGVRRAKPAGEGGCLHLPLLGTPTHWITLAEPVIVQGPYGIQRRVHVLGLSPDAPEQLERTLASHAT